MYRAAQVTGASAPGYSSGQALDALEEVAKATLPADMSYDWADLSYQERKAAGNAARLFALSLVFVFLILAALYESWSLPFSVLLSVPVAIVGAFAGLLMRRYDFDVYAQVGVDHADRSRGQERDPDRRVREGAQRGRARIWSPRRSKARSCGCGRF